MKVKIFLARGMKTENCHKGNCEALGTLLSLTYTYGLRAPGCKFFMRGAFRIKWVPREFFQILPQGREYNNILSLWLPHYFPYISSLIWQLTARQ